MYDYKAELNPKQLEAATTNADNCVVVAGAGTGKTKTMAARVCHQIEKGVQPERILAITFTRRAAAELVSRICTTVGQDQGRRVQASTFHSWCSRLIGADRQGYTVIDPEDQGDLMSLARGKRDRFFPSTPELTKTYSYCRNSQIRLGLYLERHAPKNLIHITALGEIFKKYESEKRRQNMLDLDDLLAVIAKNLENPTYAETVGNLYDDILIDEMQDTNPLQWKLIQPLIGRVRIFCVGDSAQAIFAFRGSDYRFIHEFTERVQGAIKYTLDQNYRSPNGFLGISNWLLEKSSIDYDKKLWSEKEGSEPIQHVFETQYEEAEFIAEKIRQDYERGLAWRSNLIIFRSSSWRKFLDAALAKRHIPVTYVGGGMLLRAAHIRDLLSPIRIIHNSNDDLAWLRYLQIFPGVGQVTSTEVTAELSSVDGLSKKIAKLEQLGRNFEDSAATINSISLLLDMRIQSLVGEVARILDPHLEKRYRQEWEGRKGDIPLLQALAEHEESTASFLESYSLNPMIEKSVAPGDPISDFVTVSTVHGAKGAEADIVYVPALVPGHYPPSYATTPEEIEEERRILYVALTRARCELHLSKPLERFNSYGKRSDGLEQFFLQDMPDGLVRNEMHVTVPAPSPELNTKIDLDDFGIEL